MLDEDSHQPATCWNRRLANKNDFKCRWRLIHQRDTQRRRTWSSLRRFHSVMRRGERVEDLLSKKDLNNPNS